MHVLVLGQTSTALADSFTLCVASNSRLRCGAAAMPAAAAASTPPTAREWIQAAHDESIRKLNGTVDVVVITLDCSSSAIHLLTLTEMFKSNKERVFLCFKNAKAFQDMMITLKNNASWELRASISFFQDRFVFADKPSAALKFFLKRKAAGPCPQLDILSCEDYIQDAIARRDARVALFHQALNDVAALKSMERRFVIQFEATLKAACVL